MKFTLNRDKVVSTDRGHTIEFKKGVPTHVPHAATAAVLAVGAVPETELPEELVAETKEPSDPAKRHAYILDTMKAMAEMNERDEFTGNGLPQLTALIGHLGFKIDVTERDAVWREFQQSKAAA